MKKTGDFLMCLLINMLINWEWSIPAWILLALHFIFGLNILWFFIALGLFFAGLLLWMAIFSWASGCRTSTPPKENKNPYSVGAKKNTED